MNLYLDLNKAGQNSGGTTTKTEDQSIASYKESYTESPSGVANASSSYDDPDKGKKWKHSDDDEDEMEADRQARNKKAQDKNLVPTPEEAGTVKKAFGDDANDMVKSLTSGLRDALQLNRLSASETEFLTLVKGFSHEEVKQGGITIQGSDRAAFSAFLCEKARLSLDNLYRR